MPEPTRERIDEIYRAAEEALDAAIAKAQALKDEIAALDYQINSLPRLFQRDVFAGSEWINRGCQRLESAARDLAWNATSMGLALSFQNWTTNPAHDLYFKKYIEKLAFVNMWNNRMREAGAAFEHPESKEPCLLLAVTSRGDSGRFTLQSRITKKRSGSYKTLRDLSRLKIIKDAPRKEGFIERRKEQDKAKKPKKSKNGEQE